MSNQIAVAISQHQQLISLMQARVINRAASDPAFRAALLKNPKAAVNKEFGVTLPDGVELNIVESKPNTVTIALPAALTVGARGELKDEDLEAVAGGSK